MVIDSSEIRRNNSHHDNGDPKDENIMQHKDATTHNGTHFGKPLNVQTSYILYKDDKQTHF